MAVHTYTPGTPEEFVGIEHIRHLPELRRNGKPTAPNTIHRWMIDGVRVSGKLVRLRHQRIGRVRVTCQAWVRDFLADLNRLADSGSAA